jgi:hypothetical protein
LLSSVLFKNTGWGCPLGDLVCGSATGTGAAAEFVTLKAE